MGHYRDLRAWQFAHLLSVEVVRAESLPRQERFELGSQLRRVARSVPTNIAEGQARYGRREALRFARIAAGSLGEVDYLLTCAREHGYLTEKEYEDLDRRRKHTSRVLSRLIRSLQ